MSDHSLVIGVPDDMHVHFREGDMMRAVVPYTSRVFGRALVMPNTSKPILTKQDVDSYRSDVLTASGPGFTPLMTFKLVPSLTPDDVRSMSDSAVAGKFYPEGATTNATGGCKDVYPLEDQLKAMAEAGLVLCLHGEAPGSFCMDRERDFLFQLRWLRSNFPSLRIVLEHVTTKAAVEEVMSLPEVGATITAHHLYHTLDDVVGGMLSPHAFCKPIAKTPSDLRALREAATSGDPRFFFGSDTAPHLRERKECSSGCAGVYSAPCALESLAALFDELGRLGRLDAFVSRFGADFYGLTPNPGTLSLFRRPFLVSSSISGVVPFMAGQTLPWSAESRQV